MATSKISVTIYQQKLHENLSTNLFVAVNKTSILDSQSSLALSPFNSNSLNAEWIKLLQSTFCRRQILKTSMSASNVISTKVFYATV